jgi:probable F420-dependent oxidoreductase
MSLRIGVGLPTGREGQTYRVPYVRPADFSRIARQAEALGFASLWGNDHLTTPREFQVTRDQTPRFYDPLVTFASLASVTERIRFVLSVIVLPLREPVLFAKQVATLDQLSGGRLVLGVGIGTHREEFEAIHPHLARANRSLMLEEGIQALRCLFETQRATFDGRYIRFKDVELAPKPVQQPFPIFINARGPVGLERVARSGDGWIAAVSRGSIRSPVAIASARADLAERARAVGRDPGTIPVFIQTWLALGRDQREAEARLRRSQHFRRLLARDPNRSENALLEEYRAGNLLGGPEQVIEQLRAFERAGVDHVGLVVLGDTVDEFISDLELLAESVLPSFLPSSDAGSNLIERVCE